MTITEREMLFLDRRAKLLRIWPLAGTLLLAVVGFLAAWLFWRTPLLINPFVVIEQLQAGTIPDSTLALLAGFLPLAMLACLLLMVVMIAFLFVAVSNERKYMTMIEKLRASGQ